MLQFQCNIYWRLLVYSEGERTGRLVLISNVIHLNARVGGKSQSVPVYMHWHSVNGFYI